MGYFLADGIDPNGPMFVNSIKKTMDKKQKQFAASMPKGYVTLKHCRLAGLC